jgi:hypothetical protein
MTRAQAEDLLTGRGLKVEAGQSKGPAPWFTVETADWEAVVYFAEDRTRTMNQVILSFAPSPTAAAGEARLRWLRDRLGPGEETRTEEHRWEDAARTNLTLEVRAGGSREHWGQFGDAMCDAGLATALAPFASWTLLTHGAKLDDLTRAFTAAGAKVGALEHHPCAGDNCGPAQDQLEIQLGADRLSLVLGPTDGGLWYASLDRAHPAGADVAADLRGRFGPPCRSQRQIEQRWDSLGITASITSEEKVGRATTWRVVEVWRPIR